MDSDYDYGDDICVYLHRLIKKYHYISQHININHQNVNMVLTNAYTDYWRSLMYKYCKLSNFYTTSEISGMETSTDGYIKLNKDSFIHGIFLFKGYNYDKTILYFKRDFGISILEFNVRYNSRPNKFGLYGILITYNLNII